MKLNLKPKCKIVCHEGKGNSNNLLYEVHKTLRKPEYRELYEDFVRNANHHDTCENLLKVCMNYVELIFVYDFFGLNVDEPEEEDYEET